MNGFNVERGITCDSPETKMGYLASEITYSGIKWRSKVQFWCSAFSGKPKKKPCFTFLKAVIIVLK